MNRHTYIEMLEKRASEASSTDYGIDNQAVANAEVEANAKDQREQLSPLLDAAKTMAKIDSKQLGSLVPGAKTSAGTSSRSAMLKVAMQDSFFSGVRQTELLKTASPSYIRTAFQGFADEMSKLD